MAKLLFSICEVDPSGRVLQRKDLRRDAFAAWLAQLPAGTIVAMEAFSGMMLGLVLPITSDHTGCQRLPPSRDP